MPRFVVESWSVDYGSPFEAGEPPDGPEPSVELGVELDAGDWRPVGPAGPAAASVMLVDGVRRIDARVWVNTGLGPTHGYLRLLRSGRGALRWRRHDYSDGGGARRLRAS